MTISEVTPTLVKIEIELSRNYFNDIDGCDNDEAHDAILSEVEDKFATFYPDAEVSVDFQGEAIDTGTNSVNLEWVDEDGEEACGPDNGDREIMESLGRVTSDFISIGKW